MIKLNFSGNWKLDLQNKVLSYTSDQRKKNAVYLEDEIHYVVFALDEYHQEIVRISGNYQIDESEKCLLTTFEKEGETTDTSVSVDLILPFFLLLQFLDHSHPESNRKCIKGEGCWKVQIDGITVHFRSELAAKAFCYGIPIDLSKRIDSSSEQEQRRFLLARRKVGTLPCMLRKLGIPWITELTAETRRADSAGSAISKKFS